MQSRKKQGLYALERSYIVCKSTNRNQSKRTWLKKPIYIEAVSSSHCNYSLAPLGLVRDYIATVEQLQLGLSLVRLRLDTLSIHMTHIVYMKPELTLIVQIPHTCCFLDLPLSICPTSEDENPRPTYSSKLKVNVGIIESPKLNYKFLWRYM